MTDSWNANCRGLDEYGTPLVAIHGSEDMDAVKRARLVESAPEMLDALLIARHHLAKAAIVLEQYEVGQLRQAMNTVNRVIKKAQGEL